MWPKKPDEKAEDFAYADDPEFSTIRRKLAWWASDNVRIIKDLKPPQPPGFNNRLSANWKLLLQIAQHAGGGWPEQARRSAQRFRMGLAVTLRHLDEPVRDDVARLVDVSGLWVRNVGDRHKNKREIEKLARDIVPQLGAQSRAERSPRD